MIEITHIERFADKLKLASLHVKYHNLTIQCDVCLYKNVRLWVRMPEYWMVGNVKKRLVFWENKNDSNDFQNEVIKQFTEKTGLTLEKAIEIKNNIMVTYRPKKESPKLLKAKEKPVIRAPFSTKTIKKSGDINKK